MRRRAMLATAAVLGVLGLQACDPLAPLASEERLPADAVPVRTTAEAELDPAVCAFGREFTLESENAFFPLGVGSRWMLEGEEDGALVQLRITVLHKTETVGGVRTRVVEEREWEDGELIEVSRNFFAETSDGTVCYFGEDVDIFEDGKIVSHEGAWRADTPGNFPGIIMPADPRPGTKFQMEGAPGLAEDEGTVVGTGPVSVPAGSFSETIRIREFNPLDGEFDFKVFAEDVGIIIDGPLSLVSYRVADLD